LADAGAVSEGSERAGRRAFVGAAAAAGAVIGVMIGFPVGALFAAPLFRSRSELEGQWVEVGDAGGFASGAHEVTYSFDQQDGWYVAGRSRHVLVRRDQDQWVVLSAKCTHAGCGVAWLPDEQVFLCPCHSGRFDAHGRPIAGPPTEPLVRLDARVNEQTGKLEVRET
jgi:Rieske Fe-S protein